MLAKLSRFVFLGLVALSFLVIAGDSVALAQASHICGFSTAGVTQSGLSGAYYPYIIPCSGGERIAWGTPGSWGLGKYVRINKPVIIDMSPVRLNDGTVLSKRIASWADYSEIANCSACNKGQGAPRPSSPTATPTPEIPPPVLSGTAWLGGKGVDVYYDRAGCTTKCGKTLQPWNTCAFQCVDLAVRLYAQVGYSKNFRIAKNGQKYELIATASEIKAFVAQQKRPQDDPKDELKFYPNDGTAERPPAPGDLLIFAPAASNGYAGHVAVVDTVAGDLLRFVQQNICYNGQIRPEDVALIEVKIEKDKQKFRVRPRIEYSALEGWVHSKLIKEKLIDRSAMVRADDITWNRDDTGVYIYLSPARTRLLAFGQPNYQTGKTPEGIIFDLLSKSNALAFTDDLNATCVLTLVKDWIRKDARLNPDKGVRSVDFTLKYTGRMFWLRPWGGSANSKWIPFTAENMCAVSGGLAPGFDKEKEFQK